jgi:spermidine/putrescine-binding protein
MAWLANHPALPKMIDESALESMKPLMTEWLSLVKNLGNRTPLKPFMEEKVSVGILWSGQAREILNQRPQYKWIVPSGTTFAFIDSFALPKGGAHQAEAEAFINFLLRPDIGKIIAESSPYASPNAAARALISTAELSNHAAYPPFEQFKRMSLYQESGKEQLLIDDWFQSLNDNE